MFSLLRVQGSFRLYEDLQETLYLGQICGKTPAVSVPENVFEMLEIFDYGNSLGMHACVTCGCDTK